MIIKIKCLIVLLFIILFNYNFLAAQSLNTVNPQEYTKSITNPLKGFRPDLGSAGDEGITIVRQYIGWDNLESSPYDGVDKLIDFANRKWGDLPSQNVKVIPRVYIDYFSGPGDEHWPQYILDSTGLQPTDENLWRHPYVKERLVKLVEKMGEAWDADPRIAWIQTGLIGLWGEQEQPVGVSEEGWAELLGEAYTNAFRTKKLLVRNQSPWEPDYEFGIYWDSYGHPNQSNVHNSINYRNNQGRYLTEVIEGEVAYGWGESSYEPLYGKTPTQTVGIDEFADYMIGQIKELHCTGLGWVSGYKTDGRDGTDPENVRANADRYRKAFGYRFLIPEFSCSQRADQGGSLNLSFKVKNVGSAPFYQDWPVAFVLIDETTKQIVWKEHLKNVDVRDWHPGHNYSSSTKTYQTPAKEYTIDTSINVPADITTGQYMAGITILEPYSDKPGVFFAVENFLTESQTQPLCRIGIGEDLSGTPDVNSSLFGDPNNDDKRQYTTTPQGDTYVINADTPNGSLILNPSGGSYAYGTVVKVTAKGDVGYEFESWGGDISGTERTIYITMDDDINIAASFSSVETFDLTIDTQYGQVIMDPPGGTYNTGTEVTLTPSPDPNYIFEKWGGDLSGSAYPQHITMDADKNINARFMYAGGGTTTNAINCGGSAYEAQDGINYSSDNSGGSSYSTDSDILGTEDDQLYQTERFGSSFSIDVPVENGSYEITLMFAEIFHSSSGNRVFNVSIEDEEVISRLDIYSKVGKNAAYNETHEVTTTDGEINIDFTTITDNAKISAIRVANSVYTGETFTLTMNNGSNGTLQKDPAEGPYPAGSYVAVTAIPDSGYILDQWTGDLTTAENPTYIYMDGNKNIGATFVETNWYTLTISAANGLISVDPEVGIYGYVDGTKVSLTPSPDNGYFFSGWGGDIEGSEIPATILMDGDKSVTANFEKIPVYTLTTNVSNGTIEITPAGGSYEEGTVVTVKAVPNSSYAFNGWSGDLSGTQNPTTIVMDSNKEITAEMYSVSYTLTTFSDNGSIEIIPKNETYLPGSAIVLKAIPNGGFKFKEWTGDLSGSQNPTSIIMNENKTVTAVFTEVLTYSITIIATNGTVTLNPDGGTYEEGTEVIITATPDSGFEFSGWSGDLSGNSVQESLTMNSDKNITASFTTITSSGEVIRTYPNQTNLGQNYPNPFSSETIISYQIKEASNVQLSVHNILGQKIAILVNEYQPAGSQVVKWNVNKNHQLPEGLYIFRLQTSKGEVYTRKSMLIKN